MNEQQREMLNDMTYFIVWAVFGAIAGFVICIIAYKGVIVYPKLDLYGMFGSGLAVFWAVFRRLKHVEHLPHIRKSLEK